MYSITFSDCNIAFLIVFDSELKFGKFHWEKVESGQLF